MKRTSRLRVVAALIGAAALLAALVTLAGASAGSAPPRATIIVDDHSIRVPALHAGVVALRIQTAGRQMHHLIFLRLHSGVTYAGLERALHANDTTPLPATVEGGSGSAEPGIHVDLFLSLDPGRYLFADIIHGNFTTEQRTTVAAGHSQAQLPRGRGTVIARAGQDRYTVPEGFGAPGVYRFANHDNEIHEASIARLVPGKHVGDLIAWAKAHEHGPPPLSAALGGFGALGPHRTGAFVMPRLAPGNYVLVCFIPDSHGVPHVAMGMAAEFHIP